MKQQAMQGFETQRGVGGGGDPINHKFISLVSVAFRIWYKYLREEF